jgi:hypothetical protein
MFRSLFRKVVAYSSYISRGPVARLSREERTLEPTVGQGFLPRWAINPSPNILVSAATCPRLDEGQVWSAPWELAFAEGNWVWLRLHHRLAATLIDKAWGKLAPKFYGLFQVSAHISPIAYRLALPPKCRIHDVFHVVFLKKLTGTPPAAVPRLPPIKHGRVLP